MFAGPFIPPDDSLPAKLRSLSSEGFKVLDTEHFTIAYDAPADALRPLTGRLEGIYDAVWRFLQGHDLAAAPSQERLGVILFGRHEDFLRYLLRHQVEAGSAAGIYLQENDVSAFCHTLDNPALSPVIRRIATLESKLAALAKGRDASSRSARKRRDTILRELNVLRIQRDALVERFDRFVIQHEAAHQLLFHAGVHVRGADNPHWLVEGLACQFEVPQVRRDGKLTQINHMRLADFRDAFGVAPERQILPEENYGRAVAEGRFVSLRDFIAGEGFFQTGGKHIAYRYAQAWALVYYLHRERQQPFARYLQRLTSRRPGIEVSAEAEIKQFEEAIGPVDEPFQRRFTEYVLNLRFDRRRTGR